MMAGAGWAMGFGGWLWMLLAVAVGIAVLVAIAWLLTTAGPDRNWSGGEEAIQILKARLARGEISPEEYELARRLLGTN